MLCICPAFENYGEMGVADAYGYIYSPATSASINCHMETNLAVDKSSPQSLRRAHQLA